MIATIAALFVYPVKSCRGIALSAAMVTERGLAHDREWMIVDAQGRFLTQREMPRLALITPALTSTALELAAPGAAKFSLPLDGGGAPCVVTVWRDTLTAIDQGDDAAAWLSSWLGSDVRLVRFDSAARRYCDRIYTGESRAHTAFADGYPLLVLSEASLADLNDRLATPLPIDRFRPNLVLSGTEAHEEDHIERLDIGSVTLALVKSCTRCEITTTDQTSAHVGVEPLRTLAQFRMNPALGGVAFGVNAIVAAGAGETLPVGAVANYTLRF